MQDLFSDYKIFKLDPYKLRSRDFFKNMLEYRKSTMKKFGKAILSPSHFKCPLCGKDKKSSYLDLGKYKLFQCNTCSLVSPNINFNKLGNQKVYDDPAYVKDTTREILDTFQYRKNTYAPERLSYILSRVDIKKRNIKLLDVGCGPGYFISYLADLGIYYKGLEFAEFLVKICKEKGLNVERNDVSEEKNNSYNIITLFDVVEHIVDPLIFFKILNKKLIKGGHLIAYTPNIHSLSYYLMGSSQNTLLPFQHLCFFNKRSLSYLANKSGFKLESIEYFGLDIMDYFFMKEYQDKISYLSSLKEFISVIQAIVDKQSLSNHMRVVLNKIK